jgi:hypothetical protein
MSVPPETIGIPWDKWNRVSVDPVALTTWIALHSPENVAAEKAKKKKR